MKVKIQLIIEHDDEETEMLVEEVGCLQRDLPTLETVGLSLEESKAVLANIQEHLVRQQVEQHLQAHQECVDCGSPLRRNGHQRITFRTLFGKVKLKGQRFYRCDCQPHSSKTVSPIASLFVERTAPEFSYLQAKWSSLMSYGLTVERLEEVLPLSANAASAFRQTQKVAERLEADLGEEEHVYWDGSPRQIADLPLPDERLFVGIDGGYVRGRDEQQRKAGNFQVIIGKSLHAEQPAKRFASVQSYDEKPKRRLFETLKAHGMQMNQDITFLSDGGDDMRELQYFLNPQAEHILDWFHITMKLTVMRQIAKGAKNGEFVEQMTANLDRIKWRLWHGHVDRALDAIAWTVDDCHATEGDSKIRRKLIRALDEFDVYVRNNQSFIPNYADRHRYGEPISTSFVESAVNEVVSKRMVKRQQMRWTKQGAHLLLQVRVKTLNNELREKFEDWYPGMDMKNSSAAATATSQLHC